MPWFHCWMADGKCSLKERSTSNQLGKKLTFLITFKTLALNCRTNVKINKDVMKMSGNITVQVNSRNIFLSSSYESGPISALKELIMQSWSLTHKQHAITPHHQQGVRRPWWGGRGPGCYTEETGRVRKRPSRQADFPNSHTLFPSREHAHYALNLYPILSHFSEGWALFFCICHGGRPLGSQKEGCKHS